MGDLRGLNWSDIESHEKYKGMDYQRRRKVQDAWFDQNIVTHPKFQGRSEAEIEQARGRWRERVDVPQDKINIVADPVKQLADASARTGSTLARALQWIDPTADMREHLNKMVERDGLQDKIPQWLRNPYQALEGLADDAAAHWKGKQSEAWRMEQEKKFLKDAARPEQSYEAWKSPAKIAGTVLGSAPQTVLGMGSGMLAARGLIGAGMSPGLAGILGGALGEGGMAGADAAKTAEDTVLAAPEEMLSALPEYQEMISEGRSREEARKIIARDAAMKTGSIVGAGVGILGAPSGAAVGKLLGEAGEVGLKRFLQQAGLEAGQEIPQSALERYQQNMIRRIYEDPSVDPFEGVAEAAVEGGVAGAVMGGGQAMVAGANAEGGTRNAELNDLIDEEIGTGEEVGEGQKADPEAEIRKAIRDARTADLFYKKRISDAGRADLQARVREAKSLEEVDDIFSGNSDADKYARNYARLLDGDPRLGEQGYFSNGERGTGNAESGKAERRVIPQEAKGAEGKAYTPGDQEIDFDYAVIDAGDLVTSHSDTFNENADFPRELQPRDRSRGAMQEQVIRMSNTIMPERLGHSANVGDGAPIVGDDLVVESGNGRSIALRTAYKNGKGEVYRKWLADNAADFGLTQEQVAGLKNPVLVRVRKTNVDRHGFVKDANQSTVAGMSPSEQAGSDAERLTADDMALLSPGADGDLMTESNRGFIDAFMGRLGGNESASLLGSDGRINRAGIERMRSAVFARAYQDDVLIDLQAEATDNNIRNLLGALTGAAAQYAKARGLDPSLPVAGDVTAAVRAIRDSRMTGQGVKEIVNQQKLDGSGYSKGAAKLAVFFNENIRAPRKLEAVLRKIGDVAHENLMSRNQHALFGDNRALSSDEMIDEGLRRAEEAKYDVDLQGEPGAGERGVPKEGLRGLSEADIRQAFKGRQVRQNTDGSFTVRLGNRRNLQVRQVERIDIDEAAFEVAYRRALPAGLKAAGATGSYQNGTIRIARRGDKYTLGHESFHALKDMGMLTRAELQALEREAGKDEESQARWIEDALLEREAYRERGVVYRMLQKLGDFLDGFVNLMRATGGSVVRGMESGGIYGRDGSYGSAAERYTYGGRGARTADSSQLEKAQGMSNADLARLKTGWFKGLDGEWKFEIDDSGAGTGPAWEAMVKGEVRRARLGDVMTHEALFEAYPDLAETTVVIKEMMPPNVEASYVPQAGQIWINRAAIDAGRAVGPTLLHEIQHGIQEREGFAGGADLKAGPEAYRNAPGEIEARDVAERAGFDRAQRRAVVPYSGRSQLDEMYAVPREFEDMFKIYPAQKPFQKARDWLEGWRKDFRYQGLDYLRPIKSMLGIEAYKRARMVNGVESSMRALFEEGILKWNKSKRALMVDDAANMPGLKKWLNDLGGDSTKFFMWAAARRAERLEKSGREKWLDKTRRDKIDAYVGNAAKDGRAWMDINKEFQKYNQAILDIAEQAGALKRGSWAAEDVYLPFYRVWEDGSIEREGGPHFDRKFIENGIRKLEGGDLKIDDPLKNVIRNWTHLMQASAQNVARAEAYREAKKRGLAKPISGADRMKYPEALSFLDNGRRLYFRVNDPFLYRAMEGSRPKVMDGVLQSVFSLPKRALTFGATLGPVFRMRNGFRDALHTAVVAKSFMPLVDSAIGFVKVMRKHQDFIDMMAAGGTFGADYMKSDDPDSIRNYVEKYVLEGEQTIWDKAVTKTGAAALWDFYQRIGEATEQAARVQVYSKLRKQGADRFDAAFEARDLLDFSMVGADPVVNFLVQALPFLNARVQGGYRLARAAHENKLAFAAKGGLLALASLVLWAWNRDDERYKALKDWNKWGFYHFWIGDQHFKFPKPFEVGAIFSTAFESAADTMYGNEDIEYMARAAKHIASENFGLNPLFQVYRPAVEVATNYDFFRGQNIENPFDKRSPGMRSTTYTGEFMRTIGEKTPVSDITGLSPVKMEHLVKGYLSTTGEIILSGLNLGTRMVRDMPERPEKPLSRYPLIGGFYQGTKATDSKYMTRFYDAIAESEAIYADIRSLRDQGEAAKADQMEGEYAEILKGRKGLNRVKRKLSDINKRIRRIEYQRGVPGKVKAERIEKLRGERLRLVREAVVGER